MSKLKIFAKSIIVPVALGALVGLITSGSTNYNELIRPNFAPPAIVFPIVWTILYTLMGVSYGILKSNSLVDSDINFIYYAQLIVNLLWSFFFFVIEWRLFAFLWIILLIILVIIMIIRFYRKNNLAGLLQIPYLLWLLFASFLNFSVYLLNR